MTDLEWPRYPTVAESPHARAWLAIQTDLQLAPNTIAAYGRALEDYLAFARAQGLEVVDARREHLAAYVRCSGSVT